MNAYPILKAAMPRDDFSIELLFVNGEKRLYDFKPHLNHKFYRPLADIHLFKKLTVNEGELEWVTGQDFCPHTLYIDSKAV